MTLRVAVLGAGYFARFHIDAWQRVEGAQLVSVCDKDIAKAQATGVEAYRDFKRMLTFVKPDIVDIATPPHTHATAIRIAIKSRPKLVICQKPFANSVPQAHGLTAMAERAGIPLVIHDNFRFQPWYRAMKTVIGEGLIGDAMQMTFRLRTGDGQGVDAYMDRQPYFQTMPRLLIHETGVHYVDVFRFLFSTPRNVYADLRRLNPVIAGEDAGHFILGFDDGKRAMFDGNRLVDHATKNTRVTLGEALVEGSDGVMALAGDGSVTLRKFGQTGAKTLLKAQDWPGFGGDCVHTLCDHAIRALHGDREFENTALDYMTVVKAAEAIYLSDRKGMKIVL